MPQITLTLDLTPENVSILCEVLPQLTRNGAPIKKVADAAPKPEPPKIGKSKSEKTESLVEAEAKAPPAETAVPPAGTPPSMTDIRAVALKLSKAGKQEVLKKIFAKYDADKLSGVDEKHYANLMKDLEAANG